MKTEEINLRDPYVLLHQGKYYLYGTRASTCWGPAEGFDCYVSHDLECWEGPFEIFHRSEGFFADRNYWAPECVCQDGRFYLITTLGSGGRKKGVYALVSHSPLGPFEPLDDRPLTPADWNCIDGSIYWDNGGTPYLIFSHSFEDVPRGDLCAVELRRDLTAPAAEPIVLFSAADAGWAAPVPFAKEEFGMDGAVFFSDGPWVHTMSGGGLALLWSSWTRRGYAVGVALSPSGSIFGPWKHLPEPLFPEDGGHGMLFRSREGQLLYTLHSPNIKGKEHPIFMEVSEENGVLRLSSLRLPAQA